MLDLFTEVPEEHRRQTLVAAAEPARIELEGLVRIRLTIEGELTTEAVELVRHPDHYWDIWDQGHEIVKNALDKANISIPFPQMDVHLDK